jgi:hypothetical protein
LTGKNFQIKETSSFPHAVLPGVVYSTEIESTYKDQLSGSITLK